MEPKVVQKRTWSSVGRPWARKCAQVCFGRFPGGTAHPKLHIFCASGVILHLFGGVLYPKKLILLGACLQYTFWEFSGPILERLHLWKCGFGIGGVTKTFFSRSLTSWPLKAPFSTFFGSQTLPKREKVIHLWAPASPRGSQKAFYFFASFLEKIVIRAPPPVVP